MGKRIILFRHGKSDWESGADSDHERPLARRGEKDSKKMGKFLASAGQVPDYAISSSAARAKSTLEIASSAGGWDLSFSISHELYGAHHGAVLKIIQKLPEKYQSVMLVGHDPVWSDLTSHLIGGGSVPLKTAAMACVDFEIDGWEDVDYGQGVLAWFVQPKMLP
ncbi:MAG: SixA phosphatase family protein [Gammaproteobacteria bacterium]